MEGPTFLEVFNGSDVSRELASKLHSSGTTVMENKAEMVRRSAEELEDDSGVAICVSNRTFGFLTENEIIQLFDWPVIALLTGPVKCNTPSRASDDTNPYVQIKLKGCNCQGHSPKEHRFYRRTLVVIKMVWLHNRIHICNFAKT